MAIYHLNVGHVTRTTGRSSVQSAAYITGEKLFESRRELKVSYANRQSDIVASNTLAPDHAPDNCRELEVWDRLESYEDEYAIKRFPYDEKARTQYMDSARTAMTIVVALPHELIAVTSLPEGNNSNGKLSSDQPAVELIEQFAKERFVSRGLIVTYAIHDDEGNPHAHLQVSRRSVDGEGRFAWAKDRDICTRAGIRETRSVWAELTNQMLEREGFEARITEKSFADLGVDLEPTEHRGWMADKLKEKGLVSRIVQENKEVYARNRERLMENPEAILDELTVHNATLTQTDVLKGLQKRLGDDAKLVAQCFEQALDKAVYLGVDVSGLGRYTSASYLASEKAMLGLVDKLASKPIHDPGVLSSRFEGSLEQKQAAEGLLQGHQLSVLIGRAGSGKTTTLKAVADGYKQAGYTVIGTSLSALASDNLCSEAGIEAHTVASLIHRWDRYAQAQAKFLSFDSILTEGVLKQKDWYKDLQAFEKHQLTHRHVLIVDEAGMLGTRQWQSLLQHAHATGAKVIAVGDDHQFTAIEAGNGFRALIERCSQSGSTQSLNTIHRQKEAWMKEASRHFAELETSNGLALYEQHGRVHATDHIHMNQDIAARYMEIVSKENGKTPLVLAFTNQQVNELNQSIRERLRSEDALGSDVCEINRKGMAIGDVVVFTKNDRTIDGGVYNGSRGVVKGYERGVVNIDMENGTTKSFDPKKYPHLDYGYAVTLHKSQGQTVDRVLVAASPHMDAKAVYVAMTRHRYDVELFYAKEDFKDFRTLSNRLSRFENKDMVQDYTIRLENKEAWQRVQDYRLAVLDGAASLKQGDKEAYWQARSTQIQMGKEILKQGKQHALYLYQAGLTENMLEITTGLKQRGLSLAEQRAKITVELYGEVAKETRYSLKDKVPSRNELRAERDSLAQVILENVSLHRSFFKENNVQLRALQNQVAYRQKMEEKQTIRDVADDPVKTDLTRPKEKIFNVSYPSKSYQRSPQEVVGSLNDHIKDVAYHLLGEPTHKTAKEWRYGSKGSIAIVVSGARQGLYSNFETGSSGNAVQLVADELKLSRQEAFKWSANFIGTNFVGLSSTVSHEYKMGLHHQARSFEKGPSCNEWVPVKPEGPAPADLSKEPALAYMMRGRQEIARYAYRDATGEVVGYVVRLEDKDGNKITPMLSYGYYRDESGPLCKGWGFRGFAKEGEKRPLYGLDVLTRKSEGFQPEGFQPEGLRPETPVLVVEGEKTCEAARKIFPEYTVITWSGGCGSVDKSDWSVLKGRNVTLWPDHDQPGRNAMNKIEAILKEEKASSIRQVDLPPTLPHKWDLADKMPEGVDAGRLLAKEEQYKDYFGNVKEHFLDYRRITDRAYEIHLPFDVSQCERVEKFYNIFWQMNPLNQIEDQKLSTYVLDQAIYWVHRLDHLTIADHSSEQLITKIALESRYFAEGEGRVSKENVQQNVTIEIWQQSNKKKPDIEKFLACQNWKNTFSLETQEDKGEKKPEGRFYEALTGKNIEKAYPQALTAFDRLKDEASRFIEKSEMDLDGKEKQKGLEREM